MQMVSTKIEGEAYAAEAPVYHGRPRLYLCDDLVEKLGLQGIPAPGTVFNLQARVVATEVTARAGEADEVAAEGTAPDVSLCIVFTDMGLEKAEGMGAERSATLLYGG